MEVCGEQRIYIKESLGTYTRSFVRTSYIRTKQKQPALEPREPIPFACQASQIYRGIIK